MSQETTNSAANAFLSALEMLSEVLPGSHHETGPKGTLLVITHAPIPALNPVISAALEPDAEEIAVLSAAAARITDGKVPWSIRLRGNPAADILATAAGHGLGTVVRQPFMLRALDGSELPAPNAGEASVRQLPGTEYETFARVLGDTFGVPPEVVSAAYPREVLDAPDIKAYVAEADGTAVSAAVSFRTGEYLGLGNFATPAAFQRRGYARTLAAAMLRDGLRAGASTAYLHSTEEALHLFDGLGFRTAEEWTALSAF